jgi:hypothetical protein
VLSFDSVHAITDHLYLADAAHPADRLTAAPTFLLLHEPSRATAHRLVRAVEIPLLDTGDDTALPERVHQIAQAIATLTRTPVIAAAVAGRTMLAAAIRYADVTVHADTVALTYRIDAVDTDGRFYRLTRCPGGSIPTLLIDDVPDPGALPATHLGLTAVLAALAARPVTDAR